MGLSSYLRITRIRIGRVCQSTLPKLFRLKIFVTFILILSAFLYLLFSMKIICVNFQSRRAIDYACSEYEAGRFHGSLCRDLCHKKRPKVTPVSCQTRHFGKEVVFSAKWKEKDVFVKGHSLDLYDDNYAKAYVINEHGRKTYPELADFEIMADDYLKDNYGLTLPGNIFRHFVGIDPSTVAEDEEMHALMDNVWALLQSNEFVFSNIYQEYDVFPEVYGTCGPLYIVEKVEPVSLPSMSTGRQFKSWISQVKTALKLLDLLEELESIFDEPLHICDVKPEHFGTSDFERVKVLDLDIIGVKSIIETTIFNQGNCTSHSDCDYFDCKGRCDLVQGVCANEIMNNNLQAICEHIFLPPHTNLAFELPGLLSSRHAHRDLMSALETCGNPARSRDGTRIAADDELKDKITRYLKEILSIAEKVD